MLSSLGLQLFMAGLGRLETARWDRRRADWVAALSRCSPGKQGCVLGLNSKAPCWAGEGDAQIDQGSHAGYHRDGVEGGGRDLSIGKFAVSVAKQG